MTEKNSPDHNTALLLPLFANDIHLGEFGSVQWVSSILSYFASLNYKAFGNLFCNSQKSFHTSSGPYDSNNRGY